LAPSSSLSRCANVRRPARARFIYWCRPPPSRDHLTWVEGEAATIARERLDLALVWFREFGVDVDGEIGDPNPLLAIGDALRDGELDHIILSTLPAGISRWLKMDLPSRVEAAFDLPFSHIISPAKDAGV
jgi:hypothetical protein